MKLQWLCILGLCLITSACGNNNDHAAELTEVELNRFANEIQKPKFIQVQQLPQFVLSIDGDPVDGLYYMKNKECRYLPAGSNDIKFLTEKGGARPIFLYKISENGSKVTYYNKSFLNESEITQSNYTQEDYKKHMREIESSITFSPTSIITESELFGNNVQCKSTYERK